MTRFVIAVLWAVAAVFAIWLITLPISLQAQLIAGALVVGAMVLLKAVRPVGVWRLTALALGTAIILRYVYWRTTETLPPANQLENFIPGLMLYLAEMYNVFMLGLSLFVVAKPMPSRETPPQKGELPTVDVFVPSYNEEPELLATTLAAAMAMDYPEDRFTVWLLDDGGTDQKCESDKVEEAMVARERRAVLQKLCEDLGCRYLTRARNESAKAGNLNNGLAHSTGDLIAVFDADHAPAREFLQKTVTYFGEDEKLFLVQTPHFFINPDPVERNLGTFEKMPSENEMFYGVIQRGLDKWNASFFCGSAAVLSRKALEVTDGFSGVSITEDCETAIELHAKGWNSVYVDTPLIAGLQPTTFATFIGQRSRWAQGMIQILRLRMPPFKRGLNLAQRLSYMSSTLFWLFPLSRLIFLVSPLLYLFFDAQIFVASAGEFTAYILIYMAVNLLMQNYLYGRYRWPWISELYELIQSVYLLPALISAALHPHNPSFKVTAKSETFEKSHISELGTPFFIIFSVLLLGVVFTVWRVYAQPYDADITIVVGAWNVLNLLMVGCSLGVVSERSNPRASHRVAISRRCEFLDGGETAPATIEDVSVGGARIRLPHKLSNPVEPGKSYDVRFAVRAEVGADTLPIEVSRVWSAGESIYLGCRFKPSEAVHYKLIADLIFANAKQWADWQNTRRRNIGVLRGTLFFLKLSLYATGRGFVYLLRRISLLPEAAGESTDASAKREAK